MKELFTESEWSSIEKTPAIVFKMIAAADNKVDNKELDAFVKFCNAKNHFKSELIKEVLPQNPKQYIETTISQINLAEVKNILREIDLTLDQKIPEPESKAFKHHLIALGTFVANASGKMFQHNISEEEDEAINKFAKYIDIDAAMLFRTTLIDEILKKIE